VGGEAGEGDDYSTRGVRTDYEGGGREGRGLEEGDFRGEGLVGGGQGGREGVWRRRRRGRRGVRGGDGGLLFQAELAHG